MRQIAWNNRYLTANCRAVYNLYNDNVYTLFEKRWAERDNRHFFNKNKGNAALIVGKIGMIRVLQPHKYNIIIVYVYTDNKKRKEEGRCNGYEGILSVRSANMTEIESEIFYLLLHCIYNSRRAA